MECRELAEEEREQESEQDVPATTSGFSEGIKQAYISEIRIRFVLGTCKDTNKCDMSFVVSVFM